MDPIPFNRPNLPKKASAYMVESFQSGKVSGDGVFSKRCEALLGQRLGVPRTLLTTSCTDALELAALLLDIQAGDEVILPSYTFVSTANAFALRGAKLVFADSLSWHPNLDPEAVEALLTPRTKVIVPVHYAGVSVDMDPILSMARNHNITVVEDAAQGIESSYKGRYLGSLGDLGAFSFHETKNVHCGEGGLLSINQAGYISRAEILREKGTNRSAYFRGEVDKYGWVDVGSSFLPSDILASILWAQLEDLEAVTSRRLTLWNRYQEALSGLESRGLARVPKVPTYAQHNAHAYYIVLPEPNLRTDLIQHLKGQGVMAVFHYQSLHKSPYFMDKHDGRLLPNSDRFSDCLVRLPLFHDLSIPDQERVVSGVLGFFGLAL